MTSIASDLRGQRGNILLSVMVITAILMSMGATLYNNYIVGESNEVDNSLAELRAYWAMIGHANYMLGRVGGQGLCPRNPGDLISDTQLDTRDCDVYVLGPDSDSGGETETTSSFSSRSSGHYSRVASMQYYLDGDSSNSELHDRGSHDVSNPGSRRWFYPQDSFSAVTNSANPYYLDIKSIVRDVVSPNTPTTPNPDLDGRMRLDLLIDGANQSIPVLNTLRTISPRLTVGFCVHDEGRSPSTPGNPVSRTAYSCGPNEGDNSIQFVEWNKPAN